MRDTGAMPRIHEPGEVARTLGMRREDLNALMIERGYPFFSRKSGGRPGDRRKGSWGLTDDQVAVIVRGETRVVPKAEPEGRDRGAASPASPDGKSRLGGRRSRLAREMGR